MGIKTTYVDDIDGSDLGEEATPVTFSYEGQNYSIFLSDDNKKKLDSALSPYIEKAETASAASTASSGTASSSTQNKKIREWAQSTGFEYEGVDGTKRTLGDRGQIPAVVAEAYREAQKAKK
ncbi:Lsr2 family protein [Aeromicrobium sp. Root472D3]|uniref:histone-like nucleoid-structuring protein Lsr2 n=1 Tax=Aeromicrobium sp. Root472D3 TaxID=1736540 RepID=UPI0006F843F5|nr:Lsr2 family protein [Aeromicrobium sp. Root472D3]KQX75401.1 hypothetical protein ASD10_09585 [Aeromicrobium sp. Root472D3]